MELTLSVPEITVSRIHVSLLCAPVRANASKVADEVEARCPAVLCPPPRPLSEAGSCFVTVRVHVARETGL